MKNNYLFISYFLLSFITLSCFKSQYTYQQPNSSLVDAYWQPQVNSTKGFYNLTQSLPQNYSTKGNVDYTTYLQLALYKYSKVIMPNFPILINKNGLKVNSNQTIYFPKNALLKFQGPALAKLDDVLKIYNVSNVKIINPQIEGSKNSNLSQDGQWSAGIAILNSKNITITNIHITNTFGDGLFIGSEDGGFSENISVIGGWIDNARRNGLSITSGKNIKVEKLFISNTSGHDPEAGVDVEPSWYKDIIENVLLKNIYTFNNKQAGIAVNMNALNVSSDVAKTIGLTIDGHTDQGSNHAFLTSLNQAENNNIFDAKGKITIKNSNWKNTRNTSFWTTPNNHRIQVDFDNISIDDPQKSNSFKKNVQSKSGLNLQ